jgi:hypothetical protein
LGGTLAPGSAPASGNIDVGETITITYIYARGQATIRLVYIDTTTDTLISEEVVTIAAGPYGPIAPPAFPNYKPGQLLDYSDPDHGFLENGEQAVVVYGFERMTATIHIEYVTYATHQIIDKKTETVYFGDYGPIVAPVIIGYEPGYWDDQSDPVQGFLNGNDEITIRFIYRMRSQR